MQMKQLLVIAVVAIVAISASAVVITNNNDDPAPEILNEATLSIAGNANGDEKLDNTDIQIIQDVIKTKGSLDDYPRCDANRDGKIDENDVNYVRDLIDGKATKVHVICLDKSGNKTTVEVNYPLDKVATFTSNINADILMFGGQDRVAAYNSATYTNLESKLIAVDGIINLGGKSMEFAFDNFIKNDGETHFGALIVDASRKANITDDQYDTLSRSNVPVLIINTVSLEEQLSAILTLGYLFGADTYENAKNVWNTSQQIIKTMSDALNGLADNEKKSVIGIIMGYMLMDKDSENYVNIKEAGAIPLSETDESFRSIVSKGTSVKLNTSENQLVNYDDKIGNLISIRSIDRCADKAAADDVIVSNWEKYEKYFNGLDCYENLIYVNALLPGVVKVAYMLETLYPDKVESGFGDKVFNEFITMCPDYLGGCTVDNTVTVFTYSDYMKLKNGSTA